ncbi:MULTISPECIES: type I methionyl aminopeptidase [Auritidibacter]|uniref:Methionine aminopeptidase n=1 Tax=Auritidibacter ignavus TaxID=678932 RepID=A0AAJ6AL02_9MICC|nr:MULTISPECIES: type I methionyl aminopeptidase [Auritidibacter]NIH70384.1 methionyl aminopeptidase [Auritidibacter ignavus]PXA76402.1 type I methionyl aminopeptidase [Auritidibacter sp. NML100628]PXA81382.1 type I methionyl aminopeptidase [Auritidibacter sp. NML120636]RMX23623.1 type I methionyl aminopeptidase [Auritidibacter ignavus]WGH82335.1 type I methionyl aminopeptidase [Auritidibacter ignavus]
MPSNSVTLHPAPEPGTEGSHNLPVDGPARPGPGSLAPVGRLAPGYVAPRLHVPAEIPRPDYVGKKDPNEGQHGDVYDEVAIEKIRAAGRLAAEAMNAVEAAIQPGVTTAELDRIGHQYMIDHGAYPSCLDYRGFPKSLCTSLNEVICHGIPDDTVLEDGDIINIDITAYLDGYHGDHNKTFTVGDTDEQSRLLIQRTHEAMMRGIKAVKPGREINVIGRVIEKYANRFGYGVVRDFVGHGVGREFHSGLIVPHYDTAPDHNTVMVPGMVFTIEPMITLGDISWEMWDDDWTVTTKDRQRTAQFEHTLVVREDGAEILTLAE